MIKRIAFVARETLLVILTIAFLIFFTVLLWGYFGKSALLVILYVVAWLIYGYFKIQDWRLRKKLEKEGKMLRTAPTSEAEVSPGVRTASTLPAKYRGLEIPALAEPLWTGMRASALVTFSILVLLAISWAILSVYPEWRLWLGAESTLGQVVEAHLEQDEVSYAFRAPVSGEFQTVTDRQEMGAELLKPGQTIKVKYLPSDPSVSIIEGVFPPVLRGIYLILFTAVPVLLGFLVHQLIRNVRQALLWLRLRRQGRLVPGMIVWRKLERYTDDENWERRRYMLAFAFEAPASQGDEIFVRSEYIGAGLYEKVRVGNEIMVRYLPEDPSVCEIASLDLRPVA